MVIKKKQKLKIIAMMLLIAMFPPHSISFATTQNINESIVQYAAQEEQDIGYKWKCSKCYYNQNTKKYCEKCGKEVDTPKVEIISNTNQKLKFAITYDNYQKVSEYRITYFANDGTWNGYYLDYKNNIPTETLIHEESVPPGIEFEMKVCGVTEDYKRATDPIYVKIETDNSLAEELVTLEQAKINIKTLYESGEDSYSFCMYGKMTPTELEKHLESSIYSGKWKTYNRCFGCINGIHKRDKIPYLPDEYMFDGKPFTVYTVYLHHNMSKNKNKAIKKRLQKNTNSLKFTSKTSQKTKVKKITTYIIKNRSYRVTREQGLYKMLFARKGQCMHYAWEFAVMCNLAGIDAEYVNGTTAKGEQHAWNQVKINGKWYNHDVCWADGGKKVRTSYCFRGSGAKAFNKRHRPNPEYRTKTWKKSHPMSKKSLKW